MRVPNSADSRNGPLRFTPMTLSKSSSVTSGSDGYSGDMPALFTSTSQWPNSLVDAVDQASQSSQWPTWHADAERLAAGGSP